MRNEEIGIAVVAALIDVRLEMFVVLILKRAFENGKYKK